MKNEYNLQNKKQCSEKSGIVLLSVYLFVFYFFDICFNRIQLNFSCLPLHSVYCGACHLASGRHRHTHSGEEGVFPDRTENC